MKRIMKTLFILILSTVFFVGCNTSGNDDYVTLELVSNKPESIQLYKELIEKFEAEHPNIKIKFQVPPDPTTVLRTKMTRNKIPDIISISAEALYGELGREGFLHDFSDSELLDLVQPSYSDMLARLVGQDTEGHYAIPYATNAVSVIYNKEKLAKYNLDVPTTWDEFIETLEILDQNNEIPIYFTLQDAWTAMPLWNALASNIVSDDFSVEKTSGITTFQESYIEVAEKAIMLTDYGQDDIIGVGYDDGNRAFASGEGAFYIMGNWVIPELLRINPQLEIGTFPLPVSNTPEENKLISGVDVALAISDSSKHKDEALQFIEFLLRDDIVEYYIDEQRTFSALKDVYQEMPVFEGIQPNFEHERITSFVDHYYPSGLGHDGIIQELYIQKDIDSALKRLDSEWDKIIQRQ